MDYEYCRIPSKWIPEEIRSQYNLYNLLGNDGFVYCEVRKGMYGLKQAARLAFDRLVIKLAPFGYHPVPHSPGFWVHDTRPTVFTLCVDDFGVKYSTKEDANHFISALTSNYRISINWKGDNYLGLTLKWNYLNGYVDLSMSNYIKNALTRLRHKPPTTKQYSPHDWIRPSYGSKIQHANGCRRNNSFETFTSDEDCAIHFWSGSVIIF